MRRLRRTGGPSRIWSQDAGGNGRIGDGARCGIAASTVSKIGQRELGSILMIDSQHASHG